MSVERTSIDAAAEALQRRFGPAPPLAVVLGSGLGPVTDRLLGRETAAFQEVGLPPTGVAGHSGAVHVGEIGGARAAILAGRIHMYEGHAPSMVARAVRALHRWGVERLLLTCSVGGLRPDLRAGRLVLISDHINFQNANPLAGPAYGTRFPDMTASYDPAMRVTLASRASELGIDLDEGVLASMPGPAYETPAEVRMLRMLGADVVSMSTAPEVMAARELSLPVAAIAVVANPGAGLHDRPLTHSEVTEAAAHAAVALGTLIAACAAELGSSPR